MTDRRGVEGGAIYISKDKNEMLRFTGTKASPGSIDFGKWNEELDIKTRPPARSRSSADVLQLRRRPSLHQEYQ